MSVTTMKPLYHTISEAKRSSLRDPLPVDPPLKNRDLARRLVKVLIEEERIQKMDAYSKAMAEALILGRLVEKIHEDASGLDNKLHRYTKTLSRKLR